MADLVDQYGKELVKVTDKRGLSAEERSTIDTWISNYLLPANQFIYNGYTYGFGSGISTAPAGIGPNLTYGAPGAKAQNISATLPSYSKVLKQSPPAFAAQMVRAMVLSQARFTFRNRRGSLTPRRTFGTPELALLETPWPNASTSDLISRMEWHAGLAGNAYVVNQGVRLRILRPDWTVCIYGSELDPEDPTLATDAILLGYIYCNGGFNRPKVVAEPFSVDSVAHWTPIPDPEMASLGMSWITPAIRELQAEQDIYRVTFTNGASTECTRDHIWTVANYADRRRGVTRDMALAEIIDGGVCYNSGPAKWSVPFVSPVEFESKGKLTVDPYLLGSLLGDGCFRNNVVSISCHVDDVHEQEYYFKSVLPTGVGITRRDRGNWSELYFGSSHSTSNLLRVMLRKLGLLGVSGHDKFIPERYMFASINDRVALLQGLIDTDGSVEKKQPNCVRFTNTSEQLCQQLVDLVRGLGGSASMMSMNLKGKKSYRDNHLPQWRVTIGKLPEWIIPCRLARKVSSYSADVKGGQYHYIRRVEYVGRKQAQCISVESSDNLYVTDDYILTHNTPNLVVKGIPAPDKATFDMFVDMMEERHSGLANAYRTLYLTSGADATVVGSNLEQISFAETQGASETRITALSRVPAIMIGLSEGLRGAALNAGNFGQVRRMFADTWIYPQLESLSSCLASIINVPGDAELWYDVQDMPVLREDTIDQATITQIQAQTIGALVKDGFTPESSVASVLANDMTKLVPIPGWISVQLQQMSGAPMVPEITGGKSVPANGVKPKPSPPAPNNGVTP